MNHGVKTLQYYIKLMNEEGMNVNLSFTTIYIKTLNKKKMMIIILVSGDGLYSNTKYTLLLTLL